jgi:two-component sensor histidine kinase
VIGLLRQQTVVHPELRTLLEQAIAQVYSVAIVYGLQSEQSSANIMLCDMLSAISHSLNEIAHDFAPLRLDLAVLKPIQVVKDEAVPIALVLNELMTNALKHRTSASTADPVTVHLQGDCESAQVTVSNAGVLPAGFSLAERCGTGTGLNLVLSLLPQSGATLTMVQDGANVTARVNLAPPVICSATPDEAA